MTILIMVLMLTGSAHKPVAFAEVFHSEQECLAKAQRALTLSQQRGQQIQIGCMPLEEVTLPGGDPIKPVDLKRFM